MSFFRLLGLIAIFQLSSSVLGTRRSQISQQKALRDTVRRNPIDWVRRNPIDWFNRIVQFFLGDNGAVEPRPARTTAQFAHPTVKHLDTVECALAEDCSSCLRYADLKAAEAARLSEFLAQANTANALAAADSLPDTCIWKAGSCIEDRQIKRSFRRQSCGDQPLENQPSTSWEPDFDEEDEDDDSEDEGYESGAEQDDDDGDGDGFDADFNDTELENWLADDPDADGFETDNAYGLAAHSRAILKQIESFDNFVNEARSIPKECRDVTANQYRYVFGPQTATLDAMKVTAWGGKQGAKMRKGKDQDRELHICNEDRCIFAVMDGHGYDGDLVAQHVKEQLCASFGSMTNETAIHRVVADTIESLKRELPSKSEKAGSTLAGVVLDVDSIVVFHAGDSRVLWADAGFGANKPFGSTRDHDCDNSVEVARLKETLGGLPSSKQAWIGFHPDEAPCYNDRGVKRLIGSGLQPVRGMGDFASLPFGYINEVEVETITVPVRSKEGLLENGARWLFVSSDGILSHFSESLDMQLGFSNEEFLQIFSLTDDWNITSTLKWMMDIGNAFPVEEMSKPGGPSPLQIWNHNRSRYTLNPKVYEEFPALPSKLGLDNVSDSKLRPRNMADLAVAHGNGDDCSVLVIRLD